MADIFLIVGPPATGKSTTSRALCAQFPRSVHIPVDDLRMMVSSGLVLPQPQWSDELALQVSLARGAAVDMATRYRAAEFTVVIDDFVDPHHLVEYRKFGQAPRVRKVLLHPAEDEARRRNFVRAGDTPDRNYIDAGIRHVYGLISAAMSELQQSGWLILDTTTMTVDQTVAAILAADFENDASGS